MANMKSRNLSGVNLLVTYKDSQIFEDKNRGYLTVQVDQRDAEKVSGKHDSNPYLATSFVRDKDTKQPITNEKGEQVYSHSDSYGLEQIKAIQNAGKTVTLDNGLHVIAVKADLFLTKKDEIRGPKFVINTQKPMEKSDFTLSKKTLENQNKLTAQAKESKAAEKAAQKEVPEAPSVETEQQAEAELD